jgi:hypothetical protein
MSINTHISDHKIKLMHMGRREEIILERETTSHIILPESVATILINPSLKGDTIHRIWIVFILYYNITAPWRLRKEKISKENPTISKTRGDRVRHNLREKILR